MNKIDINDRQKSFNYVCELIEKLELGLRAVSVMYDEHSADLNSKDNIFRLKDNIYYRLIAIQQHFKILLEEHYKGERYLQEITKDNPFKMDGFIIGNPHFEKLEREISVVFDSIVFNLVSVFDYLSHIICYICQTNKQNTVYWTRLAKAARGQNNDIAKSKVQKAIDEADRNFICGLYDYRSRLIHEKRDEHHFSTLHEIMNNTHQIRIYMSKTAKSHFKKIDSDKSAGNFYTLLYLAKWLITNSAETLTSLMSAVVDEISSNSNYYHNLRGHKGDTALLLMNFDPISRIGSPLSKKQWEDFKKIIVVDEG